mgnify:CR=1 FL=1
MSLTLKQKVELYENTLKRIASINAGEIEEEAIMAAPDRLYRHAFALGWVRGKLADTAKDAQWTLNQGAKK